MPTVKTSKAPAKRSTRKASPVKTSFEPIVLEFVPDDKRPDTQPSDPLKGALRFAEQSDNGDTPLIGMLYNRKSVLAERYKGKVPTGWKVTMEPTFE